MGAQQASSSNPYQGTSKPPADDQIVTSETPEAKPPAGQPLPQSSVPSSPSQPATPSYSQAPMPAAQPGPALNLPQADNDQGVVQVAPSQQIQAEPGLSQRTYSNDPDGDIVHVRPRHPGEIGEGTTIRVRLLDSLSTATSEKGEAFRSRVATDVVQDGQVVIPAGAEIEGRVSEISTGHAGGHGSMHLLPETVILPNGARYRLHAEVSGTPGSRTHVAGEDTIVPDSRAKRDGIEYGGAVGAGLVTGAIVAGPVGALAGGLIGAGAITVHLLVSHPQATLESGTVMLLTLTEPLDMLPAPAPGN